MRDFKKDEQIFIFYGARTNLEFFIHNGFVYEDNRYDGYQITLGLSQSDHLWDRRNEIFELLEIRSTETFLIDLQERPIPDKMLAFCRIFSMGESEFIRYKSFMFSMSLTKKKKIKIPGDLEKWINSGKCNQLLEKECALETELNKKTWSFLQMRFKLLLSSFKTTPSEDEALCKDPNLSDNMKLAVKMRRAERKILLYNLKYVEDRLSTV